MYTRGEGPRLDRDGRPRASASRASRCGGVGGGRVKAALPPPAARFLSREWWAPSPPFPSPGRDGRPDKEGRGLGGMLALEEEVGNKQTKKRQLGGWELHGDAPRGHPPPLPKKKKCLCLPCCPKLRKSGWASLPPGPDDDARSHRASSPVSGERGRTWAATPVKATGGASSQGPASSEERLRAGKHPSFACPVSIPAQMCILLRPHLLPLQTGMLASPSHLTTDGRVDTPGKMLRRRPLQPSQDVELGGGRGGGDR